MTKLYIGIDPGLTGAIALFKIDGEKNTILEIWDMPLKEFFKKKKLDGKALLKTLPEDLKGIPITIEHVHSMPISGRAACFSFGQVFGHILGLIDALGGEYKFITPDAWKKLVGLKAGATKDDSIDIAKKYFTNAEDWLTKRAHHNRAEALLIGLAGFLKEEKNG